MSSVNWHEIPCVRICLPFAAGIILQQIIPGSWPVMVGLGSATALSIMLLIPWGKQYTQQIRTGIITAVWLTAGIFSRHVADPNQESVTSLLTNQGDIHATVCSITSTPTGLKSKLKIMSPRTSGKDIHAIAYIAGFRPMLLPADTLILHGNLEKIPGPANQFSFDASSFYAHQGIYLRAFLDSSDILRIRNPKGIHLPRLSAQIRAAVRKIYATYLHDKRSLAVLQAMTIGIKDDIDASLQEAYARSGAIHVLSISGLHVGIVSYLLFLLVGKSKPSDRIGLKLLRTILLLCGIWAFACIAGLSPSITRAAFMFSIYLTGVILRRPVHALNVLCCTAFICLCTNPLLINSVSFQFSYLALSGIVIFFRPLYRLWPVQRPFTRYIWGTIVVSLSAQIFLLPLLVHYFQQISCISPVSSLIAIPAAYLILFGGILLILLHGVMPAMAMITGQAMDWGIDLINNIIMQLSKLPISAVSDVYLSQAEILVLAILTLLLAMRVLTQNRRWTWSLAAMLTVFSAIHADTLLQSRHNSALAVYPLYEMAVDFISGNACTTTFNIDSIPEFQAREVKRFRNKMHRDAPLKTLTLDAAPGGHIQVLDIGASTGDTTRSENYRIAFLTSSDFSVLNKELIDLAATCVVLSPRLTPAMRRAAADFCRQYDQSYHDLRENGTLYLTKQENIITHEKNWRYYSG